MEITRGMIQTAQKVVLYGPEGIGKSTFASHFPEPVFIDTEGGTKQLDVARFPKPESWQYLLDEVREVLAKPGLCRTLVLDTADWAEQLCMAAICAKYQKAGIEDFGYGKGYVFLEEEFGRLLNLLEDVTGRGIHVVVTAHARLSKFEQPDELAPYDRWSLKLTKKNSPMLKEWADMVLFANYKTFTVRTEDKKVKAQGGRRVMYTTHHPCWDAKNRHGLAEELPFSFGEIASCLGVQPVGKPVVQPGLLKPESAGRAETKPALQQDFAPQAGLREPPCVQDRSATAQAAGNAATSGQIAMEIASKQEAGAPDGFTDFSKWSPPPAELPQALRGLMEHNRVTEAEIRLVVSEKGYFPLDMPVTDYPQDFIQGVLIGAWEQVFKMIQEERDVPF
ncbi:ATP-binding protein [Butyricicoccus sp. 1XD8-22]|nr:ATP-binding protein [Butyricicoccus sp. 1XD8-22]